MQPSTLVLLHSPLTGAAAWGRLPEVLRAAGLEVVVAEVTADDQPPYAARYVALAALQIAAALTEPLGSVVLVGHSGAGPLLPALGFARRSARRPVHGYVFVDAGLPRPGGQDAGLPRPGGQDAGLPRPGGQATRLDLLAVEDAGFAETLRHALEAHERFPEWTSTDLEPEVPDAVDRALLLASLRPRSFDFFDEPLPGATDWPDAPCGYLVTSAAYAVPARLARGRGWPTVEHLAGHFAALRDPDGTAAALLDLLGQL